MYSSGMQMRLAFSVATARRPDILIVDEALSVGDAYFQHKSFDRIRNFRKEGTTLFIVSHDRIAIQAICDRAILLDNGKLAKEGSPDEVLDLYNALIAERETTTIVQNKTADGRVQTISGTGEATVSDIKLLNSQGRPIEVANVGAEVTLEVKVRINSNIPHFVLGYMIRDRFGQPIYGTNTYLKQLPILDLRKGEQINCRFDFAANLGPGNYSVTVALVSSDHHLDNNFEWRDLALVFEVVNFSRQQFAGCAWLDPVVRVQRQE
jgi:lipopolysaccharide transport system ATP-binding protein